MSIIVEPDYIYDPAEWNITHVAAKAILEEEVGETLTGNDVKRFCTLVQGPDRFLASIVLSYDEDDQPAEIEYKWFNTEEEALECANSGSCH